MVNIKFEVYKVKRELKRSGRDYEFLRPVVNKFREPTQKKELIGSLRGIYHEQSEHIYVTMVDTTQSRTKKVPSILCLYEDAACLGLVAGDIVRINNKAMKVTGIINVQEWGLIADISLEVIDGVV